MRRLAVQVEVHLVDVAPTPALGRIVALDHRMAAGMKMLERVLVGRAFATADMAARAAQAQMHPLRSRLQAFLAAQRARRYGRHMIGVLHPLLMPLRLRALAGPRLAEIGVQRRDHLRAFADGGGHALDRTRAHVADGEHALAVGFERRKPSPTSAPVRTKPLASSAISQAVQPAGVGFGADEEKEMPHRAARFLAVLRFRQRTASSIPFSPSRPTTSVPVSTSMFGCASMRSTR